MQVHLEHGARVLRGADVELHVLRAAELHANPE